MGVKPLVQMGRSISRILGQSRTLPLELLSDFAVLCPLGNLSPERLQEAELLASDPARMQRYEEKLGL